jgi:DNA-directed RNA polymerase subunit RPC12/RpoP
MPRTLRAGAALAGAAFVVGWLYRQAFPKIVCPKCGSRTWKRLGGGLKECRECSWKFFMQLPRGTAKNR